MAEVGDVRRSIAAGTGSSRLTPPAKIVFCITELEPGGAERALVEIATRIDRSRFEPVVYCLGRRPRGNPTSLADRLEASGIRVVCFGARRAADILRVAPRLVGQLRADSPQLVQTFLFHANVLGAWAARRAGVPYVVTGIRVAERRKKWHLWASRWADRYVDQHVCVSESVQAFSQTNGRLPADKLLVIPNAVDIERFANARPADRQELGIGRDEAVAVSIGRLDHQKGIDWLLEVWQSVEQAVPAGRLLLVGDGPDRSVLERQVHRLNLQRVTFAGFRRDIPEILAASDVLVLPSRWEGMPNVVLEAMAAGRAVVATNVEGVSEAIGPVPAGQIVSPQAPAEFANRLIALLSDTSEQSRIGAANRQRAQLAFSFGPVVSKYETLYARLLERPVARV